MSTSTFVQPNYTANSDSTAYPLSIDAAIAVMAVVAAMFAAHEQSTPDMTVRVDAGVIPAVGAVPTVVAAQDTGTITAPSANSRNDIIYVDQASGVVGVATGAEAASPGDPAVPTGKIAIARISLTVGMTEITNADIDGSLRQIGLLGLGSAATKNTGTAAGTVAEGDHNHASGDISDFTEAAQDVIGAMVAAAGGSYDDGAGTIAFPSAAVATNKQAFTASGTFTIPAGVTAVKATVLGAGAGGKTGSAGQTGGGGGSGGWAIKWLSGLTPGNTLTVTVGAAGAVGAAGGNSALASGTETISTITGGGGAAGGVGTYTSSGGPGGSATGGDINCVGSGGMGGSGSSGDLLGGTGGSSPFGGGGQGHRYNTSHTDGAAGGGYGAGGGGACQTVTAYAGSAGLVLIEWWG